MAWHGWEHGAEGMARLAHVNKPSFAGEEREHCHLGVLCLAPNATALVQGAPRSAFPRSEGTQECEQAYRSGRDRKIVGCLANPVLPPRSKPKQSTRPAPVGFCQGYRAAVFTPAAPRSLQSATVLRYQEPSRKRAEMSGH